MTDEILKCSKTIEEWIHWKVERWLEVVMVSQNKNWCRNRALALVKAESWKTGVFGGKEPLSSTGSCYATRPGRGSCNEAKVRLRQPQPVPWLKEPDVRLLYWRNCEDLRSLMCLHSDHRIRSQPRRENSPCHRRSKNITGGIIPSVHSWIYMFLF